MANKDFCYCNGNDCSVKEHCIRYVEGKNIPTDEQGWYWMNDCGSERIGYIDNN